MQMHSIYVTIAKKKFFTPCVYLTTKAINLLEIPPIFKNVEITSQDVGNYMKHLCAALDVFKLLRSALITGYFGKT